MREDLIRFEQHDEGLCGLYTVANALSLLRPGCLGRVESTVLVTRLAGVLPVDIRTLIREGTDRAQMEVMLDEARLWTDEAGWPAWVWRPRHPETGTKAQDFWDAVATEATGPPRRAVIVGFGDYHEPSRYYEPHWTCVARIGPTILELRDSTGYERVRRARTGIRPEPGWEIEDCFLLAMAGETA